MKTTYYGGWSANNGSIYNYSYTDTDKRRLAKNMRAMCKGNVFLGNTGHWSISIDKGENSIDIITGIIRR